VSWLARLRGHGDGFKGEKNLGETCVEVPGRGGRDSDGFSAGVTQDDHSQPVSASLSQSLTVPCEASCNWTLGRTWAREHCVLDPPSGSFVHHRSVFIASCVLCGLAIARNWGRRVMDEAWLEGAYAGAWATK
jgi:hypothetical protein